MLGKKNMNRSDYFVLAISISFLFVLVLLSVFASSFDSHSFMMNFEGAIVYFLGLSIYSLYFLSGVLILLGSIFMGSRYLRNKLGRPLNAISCEPKARYLTFGLEILIGAEILNTAYTRGLEEFTVLILTIAARSFIAVLLHFEAKWCSREEA